MDIFGLICDTGFRSSGHFLDGGGGMEIQALSGATVSQLHEEDLLCMVESGQSVKDLKKLLASRIGYSRFRQRLVSEEMGELQDDMPVKNYQVCSW